MPCKHDAPSASIVISAHNEEKVILSTLRGLLADALPGEFEILVVCNGCTDRTAAFARSFGSQVRVVETVVASKTFSINLSDQLVNVFPRVYLDADIRITADAIRKLIAPLIAGTAVASCGSMRAVTGHSNHIVRSFYRAWRLNPYFSNGKFGGVFALSEVGKSMLGTFPSVINDDEFARRSIPATQTAFVESCEFEVIAPVSVSDLIKIRTRVARGNKELWKLGIEDRRHNQRTWMLSRTLLNPARVMDIVFYLCINTWARFRASFLESSNHVAWERDDSSRDFIAGGFIR